MPYPPPATRQFLRALLLELRSLGYHANGTVIVLPSIKETHNASAVNSTPATRSSAANAKIPIPSLHESSLVLSYQ
jgi:hypothetical protein